MDQEDNFTNIEDVEQWIPCIPRKLAFGCSPKSKFLENHLKSCNIVIDLKDNTRERPWYDEDLSAAKCDYIKIPLEGPREDPDDHAEDTDARLEKEAKRISSYIDNGKSVFIHGGTSCARFACVMAMLVWNLQGEPDPLFKLYKVVLKGEEHITCDFPESPAQRTQIERIVKSRTGGLLQYFPKK